MNFHSLSISLSPSLLQTHTNPHTNPFLCMMWWQRNQGLYPPHLQAPWKTIGVWKWATDILPHTPQPPIKGKNVVIHTPTLILTHTVALSRSLSNRQTHRYLRNWVHRNSNSSCETLYAISLCALFLISSAAGSLRWKYLHVTAPADTMHMW